MLMLHYNKTSHAVLKEFGTSRDGLHPTQVEELKQLHGLNIIKVQTEPWWRRVIEPFNNVFMLVLFLAAVISVLHGDTLDAIIIISIMLVSATIYYVQRFSTERVLRNLQKHTAQSVEVIRDGNILQVDSSELVPGDIMTLREGDKIPADARLIDGNNVRVDESLLTGESVPISKNTDALKGEKEIYEQSNMLFQGSFIAGGEAVGVVVGTGNNTEFGQLASLTKKTDIESPVQKKIDKLIKQIVSVVAAVAVVAFGLALLRGIELSEAIRFVMALSVGAVPEGLPVAISVILVLGMRRMAKRKALVRTMRSIETIGVITTIATDKTGTLTQNKLTVQEIWQPAQSKGTNLAQAVLRSINSAQATTHDPLDTAMLEYAHVEKVHERGKPARSLPFNQEFAMSGNVWHKGESYELAIKGAPEHVLARSLLTEDEHEQAEQALHKLTAQGYRVIAIARTTLSHDLEAFDKLPSKHTFEFLGFLAVADILRPEAKHAIATALEAGVTVRMITGDHFETAYHIGKQLGMANSRDQVFDSRRMQHMTDKELEQAVKDIRVFSRVTPENKYRLLSILKKHNITAMTGDGVNDVPALSNSHVGVAMGSGSQIAKDAGDIILLDDNFKSIIDAMREGRIITANIRRMLYYLLSTNAGQVIAMLAALILGMPLPLVPVQILWINLVTDTSMVIPLGLEKGEKHIMRQKPLRPNAPILNKYLITRMILVALSMAALTIGLYAIYSDRYGHEYGMTIAFCALVVMQWANAFNARSDYESIFRRLFTWSTPFYVGLTIAVSLQMLAIFGPLQQILHVSPVAIGDLIITGTIGFLTPILIVEAHKWWGRRHHLRTN